MTSRKPEPLIPEREQRKCPICGKASYSKAGVHPQCEALERDPLSRRTKKGKVVGAV